MSFLGMGTMEILIILLVAFIFLGPERMAEAARTLGKWTGELRRMGSTVQAEMDDLAGNVSGPLSARYEQTQNTRGSGLEEQPLDQDHPGEPSDLPISENAATDSPVAHRAAPPDDIHASADKTQAVRKEEGA